MMRTKLPPPVIAKYYLYSATTHPGFYWPVATLFLLLRDVTFTQIGILFTLEAVLIVAGEVPTGYVGDRIGRRNSLLISRLLWTAVPIGFAASRSFPGFVATFVAIAFATTFQSGSADAWLYDTLKERLSEGRFVRVRGYAGSVRLWASAFTMVLGGALYVLHPIYPFVAQTVLSTFGLFVLLSMPKNAQYVGDDGDERLTVIDAIPLIRRKLSEPPLRSFVLYVAVFFAIVRAGDDYIQPITETVIGSSATAPLFGVDVPLGIWLGLLFASFTAVSAVGSYYTGDIEDWLGTGGAVLLIPFATAILFIAPAIVPILAVPMFFAQKLSWTMMSPIANGYINDHTGSIGRATVLSAASMVYALVRTPFMLTVGVVSDWYSPVVGVATLGALFLVVGTLVRIRESPVIRSDPESAD